MVMVGLGLTLSLSSCTNSNPIRFSDIQASNQIHRVGKHERVLVDLSGPCKEINGTEMCMISKERRQASLDAVTTLNDSIEKGNASRNALVDKLDHTEYANAAKDRAIADLKREQNISTAMKWLERIGFLFSAYIFGNL